MTHGPRNLCSVCIETKPLVPLVFAPPRPRSSSCVHSTTTTMSESQKNSRPRREKANTHPADVLLNAKQKRRSPTEKAAADKAKTDRDEESAAKAQKSRHNAVAQIAQLEDRIQREDKAYPIITGEIGPCKSKTTATTSHFRLP